MKIKKIITKILMTLCAISAIILIVVVFAGCSSLDSESKNLTNYNISINHNSETQTLDCSETINYINSSDTTLSYICFHLYPNAFRENSKASVVSLSDQHKAYPNGLSYGDIKIDSVQVLHSAATYCENIDIQQPTSNEINSFIKNSNLNNPQYFVGGEDKNILYVLFPNQLFPDDRIEISINFNVTLPNINHRFGYGNNTTNLANFYPIVCVYENGEFDKSLYNSNGDPFYSNMANYSVKLTTASDFVVSNTGEIISSTVTDNSQTIIMQAKTVRDFALVLSKEFKVLSQKVGDTDVKYYYFSDQSPETSLETAIKTLNFFNDLIGKYPYSTLSVAETNFVHGGMEFPNLVYISNDVTDPTTYQQVIVHEIGHQWWYNLVGNSAFSYPWLDEGLTEYSTILFFDSHSEYNLSKNTLIKNAYTNYSLFVEVYGSVYGKVDTSMNRELDEFPTEPEYVYTAYVKGMLLFDSLREILGEKKFEKCLQTYFEKNMFKNVTPDDMIASFEKASGQNLEAYFNAWIEGRVILLK